MKTSHDTRVHITYGARLSPSGLIAALGHLLDANVRSAERGAVATPICIWGLHGIGKTTIVRDLAAERGWKFGYAAPAQFEEMGDLHGLPVLRDDGDGPRTVFAPPDWVPSEPGPGILLLDDLNRADDRILRGLMQLLQNYGMFSWRLPPGWQIVTTANPEGGDYSVTPMDDALLTRMLHLTLVLDVADWARWARARGVDARGIDFALTYPEMITGRRTTPRSMTQFLETIRDLPDLQASAELVQTLAASALDDATVASFMGYVHGAMAELMTAADVLDATDPDELAARVDRLIGDGGRGQQRLDRLGVLCNRLTEVLTDPDYAPGPEHGRNLVAFLLHPRMPADLRMRVHRDVMAGPGERAHELLRVKELAALVLDAL